MAAISLQNAAAQLATPRERRGVSHLLRTELGEDFVRARRRKASFFPIQRRTYQRLRVLFPPTRRNWRGVGIRKHGQRRQRYLRQ